ncbi:Oxygen-independent coproporphyrinogen III oxidase (Coproporphyrinogenase) (Coprogen oxidase) [Micromonospora lupini str. Lupac 08]|uniref:Heme chaperone HemW n=2 Tax=Micromonospora lupini TaxID=285679 RepID=I0LA83_9ACTN|nr:Oxygen-independent coproporphyrinogen III oxidase (Coproporphyrinogenase) (Coprogen oxidase) [Micromonospora lupini str. Lupac 08]
MPGTLVAMPGVLPDGETVPVDGSLPATATSAVGARGFGVYVHVPFCASRCGYCDFNTYTAAELGGGASREAYADTVLAELALAARVLGDNPPPRVDTVFVGGGTPTLLPADDLARILDGIDRTWGLAADVEVTTEANPESVTPESLRRLRAAGYTRISLGMQSASPGVLAILDRKHSAGRATDAALEARDAGFEHVNLDLIYGTPGERAEDFAATLEQVVAAGVDHVSAYALIVEDGTRLAARMRRGELAYPSDDVAADRYLAAEAALDAAGLSWYEVSNWARTDAARCRHNLLYWTGADWWGLGPGAHSHVGGVRWWNVKHPTTYAQRLAAGASPGLAREVLTVDEAHMEDVMLRLRLASGLPLAVLDAAGQAGAERALADGLLAAGDYAAGRAVLTLRGRLLADAVVRDLLP